MAVAVCLPLPGDGRYQMQWDYILSSFPPDTLYVVGDEADAPGTNVFSRLNAVYVNHLSELPPTTLVVLAQKNGRYVQGNESLVGFRHPDDVTYYFGHDTRWVDEEALGTPDHLVYIPTATDDDLWSWQAYAITIWDRLMYREAANG